MRHIEASRLIRLAGTTEAPAVKYAFVERLRGAFHVETVGEGTESFTLTARGKDTPCNCDLNVFLKTDEKHARLIVDGKVDLGASTKMFYVLGVGVLAVLGLFPGTINTTGRGSAIDLMVFLFLGMFIFYDVARKLDTPEKIIDRVLGSVETEFGS